MNSLHFADCVCLPCVWGCVTASSSDNLEIERRALEYRNQTHCYQPDTQQDRIERMHQGVSRVPNNRAPAAERFYLDQTYDMPLEAVPIQETELC